MPSRILYTFYYTLHVPWREHDFIIVLNLNFTTIPYVYETT